jgi:hypothetical protein
MEVWKTGSVEVTEVSCQLPTVNGQRSTVNGQPLYLCNQMIINESFLKK